MRRCGVSTLDIRHDIKGVSARSTMTSSVVNIHKLLGWILCCLVIEVFSFTQISPRCDQTTTRRKLLWKCKKCRGLFARPEQTAKADQSAEKWILLVENDDNLRNIIGDFLAREGGYQVTGVSDCRSAILVCHGIFRPDANNLSRFIFERTAIHSKNVTNGYRHVRRPDCLVVDIENSLDGLELLKMIRSDPVLDCPVTLLTAKAKTEDRILGYEAGADVYLPKPFNPEELLSIVNVLMGREKGLSLIGSESTYGVDEIKSAIHHLKKAMMENDILPPE